MAVRVLVVDDAAFMRMMVKDNLKKAKKSSKAPENKKNNDPKQKALIIGRETIHSISLS